jgi:acyl dehydratase
MDNVVSVPPAERWFEDYHPGMVSEFGEYQVTEQEIVAFASRYDPQAMHTDPAAAAQGPFGGLIASGWHTAAMMMRMYADNFVSKVAALAAPGIDELRWVRPVRPGDILRMRVTVVEARRSTSKPDRGVLRNFAEVLNQKGDVVMSLRPINFVRCRPTDQPASAAVASRSA